MRVVTRRDALTGRIAGAAAIAAGTNRLDATAVYAAPMWNNEPEPGAQIRVLRWKQFIKSKYDRFAN